MHSQVPHEYVRDTDMWSSSCVEIHLIFPPCYSVNVLCPGRLLLTAGRRYAQVSAKALTCAYPETPHFNRLWSAPVMNPERR